MKRAILSAAGFAAFAVFLGVTLIARPWEKDREIERGRARAAERIARLHGLAFEDVYVWLARGLTEHQIVEACRRGVSPMEYLR